MNNIDNIPFSFNRDTSKWIAKLGVSHANNSFADGIVLSENVYDIQNTKDKTFNYQYTLETGTSATHTFSIMPKDQNNNYFIGVLSLVNRVLPDSNLFYNIDFKLEKDPQNNRDLYLIQPVDTFTLPNNAKFKGKTVTTYGLYRRSKANDLTEIYYRNKAGHAYCDKEENKSKVNITYDSSTGYEKVSQTNLPIFKDLSGKRIELEQPINADKIVRLLNIKATIKVITEENQNVSDVYYNQAAGFDFSTYESVVAVMPKWNQQFLTTDFWKHSQAGIIDIKDDIKPTYWYGRQHPFEFEFIVVDDPSTHKLFTNLQIIANRAKPDSFHYEIIGDSYDFAKDKKNMYFRQEAIKNIWYYNNVNIDYNSDYVSIEPSKNIKSAELYHKYYDRQDQLNTIYDYYQHIGKEGNYDYRHLSGTELVWYKNRNEFRIWEHTPAIDLADQSDTTSSAYGGRGLIASNMRYLENMWFIQINPITILYKNELEQAKDTIYNNMWQNNLPPLYISNSPIPKSIINKGSFDIPKDSPYANHTNLVNLNAEEWVRSEVTLKDRFVKIRIRYTGEELAIINYINTLYEQSYN